MTARPARRSLVLLATAGLTAGLVPALGGSASALTTTVVDVEADGLNNPRGLDHVAPETGVDAPELLFVAENGTGGEAPCIQAGDPEDPADPASAPQLCYGPTGTITMVDLESGEQRVVVEDLPSLALAGGGGNDATGPSDVSVVPGSYTGNTVSLRIVIGLGADPAAREDLGEEGALFGTLIAADDIDLTADAAPAGEGDWAVIADIAGYEGENDPVEGTDPETGQPSPPDSNPYAVLALGDETLVVDAGGNTLLSVDETAALPLPLPGLGEPTYEVTLAETFDEERTADAPPFLGAPPGTKIPFETVPTGITQVSDGDDEGTDPDLLVSELTGFPFPIGAANIYQVDGVPNEEGEEHVIRESGHTTIADVAERGEDLFVAEFGHTGLLAEAPVGAVLRDRPEGGRQTLLLNRLSFPGGVVVDGAGLVHVTNNGIEAGTGEVLSFDPSVAGDPAIQSACEPDEVVWPEFDDIEASVHEEAIACLAWWDIIRGTDADSFSPGQRISRAQTASLIARLLDSTEEPAEATSTNYFDDDNGSTHEANINRLAAVGVVRGKTDRRYAPTLDVTRGEMATLAVRTYERVTGTALPAAGNAFTDDDPSVHHDAINKAAAMGWVGGFGGGLFGPTDPLTRAQASSLLARMLSDLAEDGLAGRTTTQ